jgi:hypothetical protein
MCDVGVNSVKALKLLDVTPYCNFQNCKITAMFGTPCLLKFTCSLSQKRDVANVECEVTVNGEQLTRTAKWDDVLKLYKVDKHDVYRPLPKVIERFI